jgi:exosortase
MAFPVNISGLANKRAISIQTSLGGWRTWLVVSATLWLYAGVLRDLVADWWNDPGASYGFVIPPFALYFAWKRRREFSSAPESPAIWGLAGVTLACMALIAGRLGSEFFVTRLSLIVLLAALVWTFHGFARLRVLAFPLLLLATAIPLPQIVYSRIAVALQLLASETATGILRWFGETVYRDGNILRLPGLTLGVAEACSGLHSMASLAIFSVLIGYVHCPRVLPRVLLFSMAVPVAIAANVFRVTGTALLAGYSYQIAMGFYHSFSGWLVFLGSAGVILLLARSFERRPAAGIR